MTSVRVGDILKGNVRKVSVTNSSRAASECLNSYQMLCCVVSPLLTRMGDGGGNQPDGPVVKRLLHPEPQPENPETDPYNNKSFINESLSESLQIPGVK